MPSRSLTWQIWGADLQSPSPSTHGIDAERRKMPQIKNCTRIPKRFLKDPQFRQSQKEIGWNVAKCREVDKLAHEDHSYTLTKTELSRSASNWSTQQTVQEQTLRWPLDPIKALQLHWKILSTENLRNINSRSHHMFKTEGEATWNSQNHTEKEPESIRKLGGDSGHHLPLQTGGRAIGTSNFFFSNWYKWWFRLQSMKSTLTDEVCRRCTPHTRSFSCKRSSSLPACRSSSFSHSSLSLTTSLTPASHLTLQDLEIPAPITRNKVYGSMAVSTPLTGCEPNETDNVVDMEANASFFQDTSVYNLGDKGTESPDAGIDDEHIRKTLMSSLTIQEQEAEANLRQAYHSNDESSLPGAPSIFTRKSNQVMHRYWVKSQKVKLSETLSTSCLTSGTWRIFTWNSSTCLLRNVRRGQLIWTFLERFLIFTTMWWIRAHSAIRGSWDFTDRPWADYERKNLEMLSFWTMDQQKLETTFGFLIILDGATSDLTAYPCKSTSPSEVISWMDGHFPDESEGDLCRYGFPSSSRYAGNLSNA